MTIKVQGETYKTPEEVITAIGELSASLEDLPETHPGRADLTRHIELLRTAVSPGDVPLNPPTEESAEGAGTDSPIEEADSSLPPPHETPEEDEDEEDGVPPGYKLCPVCRGAGLLVEDAPEDPDNEQCPTCHGHGRVLTGSHVEGHMMKDCPACQGNGYTPRRSGYAPTGNGHSAAAAPSWPGATWNETESKWEPPPGEPPWTGAIWDSLKGAYA